MTPKAIVVTGPPGSGKGTQAELIANYIGGVWYDTGTELRKRLAKDEALNKKYAKEYAAGKTLDSHEILLMVLEDIKGVFAIRRSIVLSGSPKSTTEAFGSGEGGLMHLLHDTYGKDNVLIFHVHIPEEESIKRNTHRKNSRSDDVPETIKARYEDQYTKSIVPAIEAMQTHGYKVIDIDGMPSPEEVFESIKKYL